MADGCNGLIISRNPHNKTPAKGRAFWFGSVKIYILAFSDFSASHRQ